MKDVGAGYIAEGIKTEGNQYVVLLVVEVTEAVIVRLSDSAEATITALDIDGVTSVTYTRAPFVISSNFEANTNNEFPKVTINIATVPNSTLSTYVRAASGLKGCTIHIIRTFRNLIGTEFEATYRESSTFKIDSTNVTDTQISFSLITGVELSGISIPRRKYYKNFCQRKYILATDGEMTTNDYWTSFYCNQPTGEAGGCNRTYVECCTRGYDHHFGAFPDIPRTRYRVWGSGN